MPSLIGDSIMVFPLINYLKKICKVSLVCNDYIFDFIQFSQKDLKVDDLSDIAKVDLIIDFLGDEHSASFLRKSEYNSSIGFKDGFIDYDLYLKQPKEFIHKQASEIYLQVLELIEINKPPLIDFSFSYSWSFKNQDRIIIIPVAGNLKRCYAIDEFVVLIDRLKMKGYKASVLLRITEKHLKEQIPEHIEVVISNNIEQTILLLADAKLVIVNEGGFMHISASYGIPLLGLFKTESEKNWFPYTNPYQHSIKNKKSIDIEKVINKTTEIYESIGIGRHQNTL